MKTFALYVSFLHLLFAHAGAAQHSPPPYIAPDYILLNCGSSSTNSTAPDGRNWEGDFHSKFYPHNIQTTSNASTPTEQIPSVAQVPYMTARIFPNNFTYSFPVSSGLKFVRLYFYPATYAAVDKSKSFFSVTANDFTLLRNFSAFLTILALEPPAAVVVKEFIIPVLRTQCLNITFISLNSYAFINGIEVMSIPDNLYMNNAHGTGIKFVDYNSRFYFDGTTALETMYRLNVGGKDVSGVEDTGMFRSWVGDSPYVIGHFGITQYELPNVTIQYTTETPAYTAPKIVYKTFRSMGINVTANLNSNLTWNFTMDAGFSYLFRLHFCETIQEVVYKNDRVFQIFIDNQMAETDVDVIEWSGSTGIPVYKDYIVLTPNGNQRRLDLLLALHPNVVSKPRYEDALLNGVEIFKLNRSDGSLAGHNPDGVVVPTSPEGNEKLTERKKRLPLIIIVTGGVTGVLIATSVICIFIFRRNTRVKDSGSRTSESRSSWVPFPKVPGSTNSHASSLQSHHCRNFLLVEIRVATRNFDEKLVIGSGGFGIVYKGYIDGGSTTVAIKRLNASSKQGVREFWTEIELLSQLRHVHLVPLIGYCEDQGEMILVYDFMARGTLREHLHKTKNPPFPWKRRLQICIGAARGLEYLHCGAKNTIIHRDVKSTNILLDEKWVAKVSDFGLSRLGPTCTLQSHVSTVVRGSFGYVDPEYYRRQKLTVKSDVYSFGVVLLEILCGRPAVVRGLPKDQVSLAEWGRKFYRSGTLSEIVDPNVKAEIAPACLKKFGEIVDRCLRCQGEERPNMSDVLWGLEFALQLQEYKDNADKEINELNMGSQIGVVEGSAGTSTSDPGGEISTVDGNDLFSGSGQNVSDNA
ncbi:receptor-like protein kinase FERONIA [Juglans microcarpa x Juglans regia]|uniref:receptor-like protein kinase FERONIA n=1 Tax=Juglans microcarpa x Juglans regia TaxID=2249226 RepID=UPI001B7E0B81|nr:receptor-like protein kinase FERONIA [Juglans microcarpa x Juglans regia]